MEYIDVVQSRYGKEEVNMVRGYVDRIQTKDAVHLSMPSQALGGELTVSIYSPFGAAFLAAGRDIVAKNFESGFAVAGQLARDCGVLW